MNICVSLHGPTIGSLAEQLARARKEGADLMEIRFDCLQERDHSAFASLFAPYSKKLLFTLRTEGQSGRYSASPAQYEAQLMRLAQLRPAWIDIELSAPSGMAARMRKACPQAKILLSHHSLEPVQEASDLFVELQSIPADAYKLAVPACSCLDAMDLLHLCRQVNREKAKLCAIALGKAGSFARVLAPLANMPMMFASLSEQEKAFGQLSLQELRTVYNQKSYGAKTQTFALIGDPVDKSPGAITHNALFRFFTLDAAYTPITVQKPLLPRLFKQLRQWPCQGLSVTMPLKEAVVPLLDHIDDSAAKIGAVNTIGVNNNVWTGYNTDGEGALNAIEAKAVFGLKGAHFIIAGAGATAAAVAVAAKQRGAKVTLVNRDANKAAKLADRLEVEGLGLSHLPRLLHGAPAVFANCTSVGMAPDTEKCLCLAEDLRPATLVFDAVHSPVYTRLIRNGWLAGCTTVTGMDLFIEQAILQYRYWFSTKLDEQAIRKVMETTICQLI